MADEKHVDSKAAATRTAATDAAKARIAKAQADAKAAALPQPGEPDYDPTKAPGYREYPKYVDGITVASKDEEEALKAGADEDPPKKK